MDLENLKLNWHELTAKIEKNEILNKRMIKDMIRSKTKSAYEKIFWFDAIGVIVLIITLIFLLIIRENISHVRSEAIYLIIGVVAIGTVMQIFLLSRLKGFNIYTNKLHELNRIILTYRLWVKRNMSASTILAVITMLLYGYLQYLIVKPFYIILSGVVVLFIVVANYLNMRFYDKNLDEIRKGLKELEEFEEEIT